MGNGHDHGVDWWSTGIVMFEMLSGYTPFYVTSTYDIYKRIASGNFQCPQTIEAPAKNLICKLLEQDVTKRLGC